MKNIYFKIKHTVENEHRPKAVLIKTVSTRSKTLDACSTRNNHAYKF